MVGLLRRGGGRGQRGGSGQGALAPLAGSLGAFGAFWGSVAVSALDLQRLLGLSPAGLGGLLTGGILAASVANWLGSAATERLGTRPVLAGALVVWSGLLVAAALVGPGAGLAGLAVAALAVGGALDVAANVAATAALGGRPGRLMRFHASFNGGAVVGAAATAALAGTGASFRWAWAGAGVAGAAAAAWVWVSPPPAAEAGQRARWWQAFSALRSARLGGLAAVFALAAMAEGGVEVWGVAFLRSRLAAGALAGAAGYLVGQSLATGGRLAMGAPLGSLGGARGAALGAGAAAAGLAVELASPSAPLAAVGLGLAVVGISACWPLLLAQAGGGRRRPGLVVGGMTTSGYLGMLVGPSVVGAASTAGGARAGLAVLAVCAGAVATLAPRAARVA
jgi:hypothetical protein